jgi:hypothetical protein
MKCDFQASLLARTFVNPYLGHEPKAKIATILECVNQLSILNWENKSMHISNTKQKINCMMNYLAKTYIVFLKIC